MDIVAFLTARLDEDEQVAQAVEDNSAPFDGQWKNDGGLALRTYNDWVLAYLPDARPFRPGVLDHIARHDPARVLADVAAKRAILARHSTGAGSLRTHGWYCEVCDDGCAELPALAAVYADHPDYDESWRP
jgi:hypothetical protein